MDPKARAAQYRGENNHVIREPAATAARPLDHLVDRRRGVCRALALFGGLCAALGALSGPIKSLYGYVSGYPSFPNCRTTITREAKLGPVWYRVVDVNCPGDTMHFVYVKRGTGPGFFAIPAFFSAGSPVPVSVRQTADGL